MQELLNQWQDETRTCETREVGVQTDDEVWHMHTSAHNEDLRKVLKELAEENDELVADKEMLERVLKELAEENNKLVADKEMLELVRRDLMDKVRDLERSLRMEQEETVSLRTWPRRIERQPVQPQASQGASGGPSASASAGSRYALNWHGCLVVSAPPHLRSLIGFHSKSWKELETRLGVPLGELAGHLSERGVEVRVCHSAEEARRKWPFDLLPPRHGLR